MKKNRKKVFILLPEGTTIRNFLTTNLIKYILENKELEVICLLNNPEKYSKFLEHPRISYFPFYRKKSWSISSILLLIIRSRFFSINENRSILINHKTLPSYTLQRFIKYPFPKSKIIFNFFKLIHNYMFFALKEVKEQFDEHNPDLVFATHLIKRDEYDYLKEACQRGIKTIGMVKSFDNITGKGFFAFEPEKVIVWNKIMKKQVLKLYNYKKEDIFISGVPQFDLYAEQPDISKDKFFKDIGLDPAKKTILYATNCHYLGIDDPKNIKYIQSELQSINAQLIVRIHFDDFIERYPETNFKNVYFQIPGGRNKHTSEERVAHKEFIKELRDTLYFSDVTINTASTMTLDAMASSKPVININFDWEDREYSKSVKRFYDLVHYETIVKFNKNSMARSKENLIELIKKYLSFPEFNLEGRSSIVSEMLEENKGNASKKISEILLKN